LLQLNEQSLQTFLLLNKTPATISHYFSTRNYKLLE